MKTFKNGKGIAVGIAAMMMAATITGCGNKADGTYIGNPWRECSEEEARENCEGLFKLPEEDLVCGWTIMDSAADPDKNVGPMVQLDFRYAGYDYSARAQQGVAETEDISGMYYDWNKEEDATLENWGNIQAKIKYYDGEDEDARVITWYDSKIGTSYCLDVAGDDLGDLDITAVAENMHVGSTD